MAKRPKLVQFADLRSAHFAESAVWASCHSFDSGEPWFDDTDEETFRPWTGPLPARADEGMLLVKALFTLRDGTTLTGFITPHPGASDPELGIVQPHIFLADGRPFGFWFGMLEPTPARRAEFYQAVGRPPADVFPMRFTAETGLVVGVQTGQLAGFYSVPDFKNVRVTV
jgi:hypothetical protein